MAAKTYKHLDTVRRTDGVMLCRFDNGTEMEFGSSQELIDKVREAREQFEQIAPLLLLGDHMRRKANLSFIKGSDERTVTLDWTKQNAISIG